MANVEVKKKSDNAYAWRCRSCGENGLSSKKEVSHTCKKG